MVLQKARTIVTMSTGVSQMDCSSTISSEWPPR